jgi:hypothetical protein
MIWHLVVTIFSALSVFRPTESFALLASWRDKNECRGDRPVAPTHKSVPGAKKLGYLRVHRVKAVR